MHLTLLNDAYHIINVKNDLSSTNIVKQLTNNKTKNSNGFLIQTSKLYYRSETQQSSLIIS
jgi:6-phosphogluconate dehydrogenase